MSTLAYVAVILVPIAAIVGIWYMWERLVWRPWEREMEEERDD